MRGNGGDESWLANGGRHGSEMVLVGGGVAATSAAAMKGSKPMVRGIGGYGVWRSARTESSPGVVFEPESGPGRRRRRGLAVGLQAGA